MSNYKLPDILGGGVVNVLHGMAREDDLVDCVLSDGSHLALPQRRLTKIEDPLPEEPPVGSVVRAQLVDEDRPWVWERSMDHHNGSGWYMAGADSTFEWAALCTRGTPVLLAPAPERVINRPGCWPKLLGGFLLFTASAAGVVDLIRGWAS
jgi:hypothetical protein